MTLGYINDLTMAICSNLTTSISHRVIRLTGPAGWCLSSYTPLKKKDMSLPVGISEIPNCFGQIKHVPKHQASTNGMMGAIVKAFNCDLLVV